MADGWTAYEKIYCVQFEGLVVPFGTKVSYKPISAEDEGKTASAWQKDAFWCSWNILYVRWEDGQAMCSSRIAKISRTGTRTVAQERKLLLPFADGSLKLFDLPRHQRGGMPVKGSLEQDERKKKTQITNQRTVKTFWSTSRDFKSRHHEVHRANLYVHSGRTNLLRYHKIPRCHEAKERQTSITLLNTR